MDKLWKTKKIDKAGMWKSNFESGSQLRVGKILAPHNVRLKTVPLIKNKCDFIKCLFFERKKRQKIKIKTKKNIFYFRKGPDKVWPCSYVFPLGMKNQGLRSSMDKIVCRIDIFICDIFVINFFIFDIKMIYFESLILNIAWRVWPFDV